MPSEADDAWEDERWDFCTSLFVVIPLSYQFWSSLIYMGLERFVVEYLSTIVYNYLKDSGAFGKHRMSSSCF